MRKLRGRKLRQLTGATEKRLHGRSPHSHKVYFPKSPRRPDETHLWACSTPQAISLTPLVYMVLCWIMWEGHTNRGRHLSPLQHHILGDSTIGVHIHALVLVTQQHLHSISFGEHHDGMGRHLALDLDRRHTSVKTFRRL